MANWLRSRRRLLLIGADAAAWGAGLTVAALARVDFDARTVSWPGVAAAWLLVVVVYMGLGWRQRLHQGRTELASLDEIITLALIVISSGLLLCFVNAAVADPWMPRSVPLMASFVALAIMGAARAAWRLAEESARRLRPNDKAVRVLILGAGDGGRQLIRSMRRAAEKGWNKRATDISWDPVGLLDDDLHKRHLRIYGVAVMGTSVDIRAIAERTNASVLVVAIPSADATFIRAVSEVAMAAGLAVKVVPSVDQLLDGRVDVQSVRDINVEDLLGRQRVETDVESIAHCIAGRRVLVTGAGGSIGSELCRQLYKFEPAELIMLDRDESALHAVQLSIHGRALLDSTEVVLGDIRDAAFVDDFFRTRKPQVVFHAAALKHLPLLEQYPGEAVKTNVWGTLTVLEASRDNDVETFVNISTDKAADPCSVLGYSKRIAEGLTASMASQSTGTYLSVRFGNVLGSRGSVLVAFTSQIASGGPVTVTDPDVTRYFMTVQEAVELVIQAAAIGRDGEALVLDMGSPVRIDDVARQLIKLSGKPIDIQYTGLRPGEKMDEVLFGEGEPDERPVHPLVSHVEVPPVGEAIARALLPSVTQRLVAEGLRGLCLGMRPSSGFQAQDDPPAGARYEADADPVGSARLNAR
jgi:FlaA1/EpsC-like NDP-sugar epimerase